MSIGTSDGDGGIEVSAAIRHLRDQIEAASVEGQGSPLAFVPTSIEVELEVSFGRSKGGEAGIKAWVVSVGGKGEVMDNRSSRVKLVLVPVDRQTGKRMPIADITG